MAMLGTSRGCMPRPCASASSAQPRAVSTRAAGVKVEKKTPAEATQKEDLLDVQPDTKQVQQFLSVLVAETSIAELHLQVGSFEMKVRRSTGGAAAAPSAPPAAAAAPQTLIVHKSAPMETMNTMESLDESIVQITSPKVGVFRRGKYVAGKRVGKNNVTNVGDQVKKGQSLAFVEQLGTFVAVEAPQAGEVVQFLLQDGAPVEYKQEVIELAPFFGGHIVGNSKYV